jgi:hypothetical protein
VRLKSWRRRENEDYAVDIQQNSSDEVQGFDVEEVYAFLEVIRERWKNF